MKLMLPIAGIALLCGTLFAMGVQAQAIGDSYKSYLPDKEINDRIAELDKRGDPGSSTDLIDRELNRLDNDLGDIRMVRMSVPKYDEMISSIQKQKSNADSAISNFGSADCKNDIQKNYRTQHDLQVAFDNISNITRGYDDIDLSAIDRFWPTSFNTLPPEDACKAFKAAASDTSLANSVLSTFDSAIAALQKNQQGISEYTSLLDKYSNLIKSRQAVLQNKLASLSPKQQISNYLWIIMIVIGASGVLTMLVVRAFPIELQMEWVASGQVIQFVTVLILLSVIMALGLSGILNENTLGTLLGGIAGYVLAQGVGRAAAHDTRKNNDH